MPIKYCDRWIANDAHHMGTASNGFKGKIQLFFDAVLSIRTKLEKIVFSLNGERMSSVIETAQSLMRCPSVTPTDAGCLAIIEQRLAPLGFTFERWIENGVSNVWARRGTASPLFVFLGHTDVVPPGPEEAWTSPPFEPTQRNGNLYGRGAADMKGSIAAMICAFEAYFGTHPHHTGSLGVILTSDEEGPALDGTRRIVEYLKARRIEIDYCLVGEPTCEHTLGDTIKIGRRGSLSGRVKLSGIQGHVAYPDVAKNAALLLPSAISALNNLSWTDGDDHFPNTHLAISNVNAGTGATNVIPGKATIDFNIRYHPHRRISDLKETIQTTVAAVASSASIHWSTPSTPYFSKPGGLFNACAQAIETVCRIAPKASTGGGTSDGRFINEIAKEVIEFGPKNHSIHQVDEHIPLIDLTQLQHLYHTLLNTLMGIQ